MKMMDLSDWVNEVSAVHDKMPWEFGNQYNFFSMVAVEAEQWHREVCEMYKARSAADEAVGLLKHHVGHAVRTGGMGDLLCDLSDREAIREFLADLWAQVVYDGCDLPEDMPEAMAKVF